MWDRNFTAVLTISLTEKRIVAKFRDSIIANRAQVVARILTRRLERKTEEIPIKDQLGFRGERYELGCNLDAENNIKMNLRHK
jgi:hypothetical protein